MKKEKGITLVALVVTIIILLILAGVALALVSGGNGILNKVEVALDKTKEASAREKLEMELISVKADVLSKGEKISLTDLDERKEELADNGVLIAESGTPRDVTVDGYTFKVKDDLTIEGDGIGIGGNSNLSADDAVKEFLIKTNENLILDDIFASNTLISRVLQKNENIDYILSNQAKYGSYILNDSNMMKKFASNEYAMNKMIEDDNWRDAILASETAIVGLDASNPVTVPTMTSNNTPSGTVFASSVYSTEHAAWKAFDNNSNTYWNMSASVPYTNQYVGYDFGIPIWVYKIVTHVSNGKQNADYVIEGSNDAVNYTIIKDGLHQGGGEKKIISNSSKEKYRYYRLRYLNGVQQSGDGNTIVATLQFYGKK